MNQQGKFINPIILATALILVIFLIFSAGFMSEIKYANNNSSPPAKPLPAAASVQLTLNEQVEVILSKMSDEEKIGQLLIVGLDGPEMDDTAQLLIQKYHIGGIVLFDRNMINPSQTANLVNQLQKEALKQNAGLPLFICIDQEGGLVTRMRDKVSNIPSQKDLAKSGQPAQARVWAEKTADELKAMGINVNFAPVVDLGATYKRSYGTTPDIVENFAREALGGYQKKEILACLKHFPGIGKTKIDPHKDTYIINADRQTLEENDLVPFRNLIKELDNQNFMVMVSHLKYPAYDGEFPASLSSAIMQDLLRRQLGFSGIIATDDMEMGALTKLYSFEEMGYRSINAGADLALVCHNINNQAAVYNGLLQALKNGVLNKETLDDRVRRLIRNKLVKINYQEADPALAEKIVGK